MSQTEHRAHPRVPVEIEVNLESDNNFYSGLTSDISEGGVFIATYTLPAIGEQVEMELRLPGQQETFSVRGVVRWLRELSADGDGTPPGFGLEWFRLSSHALTAIQRFTVQ